MINNFNNIYNQTVFKGTAKKISSIIKPKFSEKEIKEVIDSYMESSYINDILRSGQQLNALSKRKIEILDYAIENAKPLEKDLIVYRGIEAPKGGFNKEILNAYINNNLGYVSLAKMPHLAIQFSKGWNGGAFLEVLLPKGTKVLEFYNEYLLPRNSKFEDLYKSSFSSSWFAKYKIGN